MKPVLIENAFEAWSAAIRFCDDIKSGKATLQYQKNFVSSLHNAVELIMKQMLLNNNDHSIAKIRNVNDEKTATLQLDYFKAKDLNEFFRNLNNNELSKFSTINFKDLIILHQKILGDSLNKEETLKSELKLLQRLRNHETHFMIHQSSFLSEDDFCTLHNFMIRFYKIMEDWCPNEEDDYEKYILPYWGTPEGAYRIYDFNRERLENFSYRTAVKNSRLAKKIATVLENNPHYGAIEYTPYTITKDIFDNHADLSAHFDEIWSVVYMMQSLGLISVDEIIIEEEQKTCFQMNVCFE